MPTSLLFPLTVLLYVALAFYYRPGGGACCRPTLLSRLLLFLPLALHLVLLDATILPDVGLTLGFGSSVSAMAALTVLFYGLAAWAYPVTSIQGLVLAFAALAVVVQALIPGGRLMPMADQPLFRLHMLMAFTAYGLFAVATLQGALMSLAEKHLHKPVPPRMVASLPPLLTLEQLLFRMIEAGFVILTLTLASGVFFSEAIYGRALPFTHMTILGIVSWLIYAGLLTGRRAYGWRGKRAIHWAMAGFVSLLLAYVGVNFVNEVVLGRP